MKNIGLTIFAVLSLVLQAVHAQYLSLSYPKYNSVLQRDGANQAVITIAGQLVWGTGQNGAITPGTTISYKIKTLSVNPNVQGPTVNLSMASNGVFYTTTTLAKGWYLVEVMLNGVVYASSKVGVGDVFVIAGQSNAQGIGGQFEPMGGWKLPATAGFPEWIVGINENYNCTKNLLDNFGEMFPLTDVAKQYNWLGPTGNNAWCYAMLGKKLSDANGGMPVAFFNTASGGSTITQWYLGAQGLAAPNPYTGGTQFCLGYKGGSMNPADYYGQPYTPLRSTLNCYASLFGVRAVLWHQGEADSDANVPVNYKASSAADYQTKLQFVINKSRTDFGATINPNILSWVVSKATISKYGPLNNAVRTGQGSVVGGSTTGGPDTDYVVGGGGVIAGIPYRRDSTHFEENYSGALTWLAGKWFDAIGNNGNKISAGFVPQLTYASNGNKRYLIAPAGYSEYRWGFNINSPIAGASTNTFTTENCYSGIKCFIRDSKGNWHMSATTWVHCYASNRIAAEMDAPVVNADELLALTAFPNPFQEEFQIEFDVKEDASHVRLELVDESGTVLKTLVDNPHAKGRWKYHSGKLGPETQILLCRLKVNELYTVKRLLKGN
ncbi:hypothetical protein SAMN04487996_11592 [Dyadobacter soli]|uniref:Sialate O-acetylesterase domain-containing protein n=1 Tax=Dyadobacter soli TaxID=659014 RepID=A0A1G7RLQ7_9BACT|nr:sialate O-acetylesterase [Dyadobacter soli]SDG11718.1 hypothetical protein SAMN04487996_11592 [Dyadobacter soli]